QILGCWVCYGATLDPLLIRAIRGAWTDPRYASARAQHAAPEVSILLSLLYDEQRLGALDRSRVAVLLRLGRDSLAVVSGERRHTMLAHFACHNDWSADDMTRALVRKAGLAEGSSCNWLTYSTSTWLGVRDRALPVKFG